MTTKAKDIPAGELLRKLHNKIRSLEVAAKHSDFKAQVLADLRAGIPVIVVRENFKWEGEIIPRLSEFLPDPALIPRVAQLMESMGRYFAPKIYQESMSRLKVYQRVVDGLAPLVSEAGTHRSQASQARQAEERAKQAVEMYKHDAELAEALIPRAEKALKDYMGKLEIDI